MSKLFLKTTFLPAVFCLIFAASNVPAVAQCDGFYYKRTTHKLLAEKVVFYYFNNPGLYADMTGDGIVDLIGFARNDANTAFTKIYILPGDGAGDFRTPIQISLPTSIAPDPSRLKIADYNSDGKKDLLVLIDSNPTSAIVYKNNGSGNFTALNTNVFSGESVANWVDINGDGIADLISRTNNSPSVTYYRPGNADGSFGTAVQLSPANYEDAGDFNGDGKVDFPLITYDGFGRVSIQIYLNLGNGTFALNGSPVQVDSSASRLAKAADFNNDGKSDLVFDAPGGNGFSQQLFVLLSLGDGSFSKVSLESNASPRTNLFFEDFNGDNVLDVLVQRDGAAPQYKLFTSNGAGGFTLAQSNGGHIFGTPIGDLDGDHKADFILINNLDYSTNSPRKIFNETQLTVIKRVCSPVGQTKIADFDGDGLADPTYWRESDGRWRYKKQAFPYDVVTFNWGQAGDIPMLGDYDGDGKTDFAVYRPSTGSWYYVNSSNGSFAGVQFGANGDKPVASDYNGDGRTDIAVYRPSTGAWYVLYSGTNQFYGAQFGASEDQPVPEDYDGDGKTDFAVFRPSNGVWYVLRSSDLSYFGIPWGLSSDTLVPADYDGDGKADIAVVRPGATNIWYIYRSSNAQSAGYPFGTAGDSVQASDWDGNGIWDAGVFRSTTDTWYSSAYFNNVSYFVRQTNEVPIASLNRSY